MLVTNLSESKKIERNNKCGYEKNLRILMVASNGKLLWSNWLSPKKAVFNSCN